jgi:hypothetical protein
MHNLSYIKLYKYRLTPLLIFISEEISYCLLNEWGTGAHVYDGNEHFLEKSLRKVPKTTEVFAQPSMEGFSFSLSDNR